MTEFEQSGASPSDYRRRMFRYLAQNIANGLLHPPPLKTSSISDEDLTKILNRHILWLNSFRTEGECANLSRLDLSGKNLIQVDLTDAYLNFTIFKGAVLKSARFDRAQMMGANFEGAELQNALMRRSNLAYVYFNDANLQRSDLSNSYCYGTHFAGAKMRGTILHGCNLREALVDIEGIQQAQTGPIQNVRIGAMRLLAACGR